ncbi:MAG: ATP-grasp domain-containing protein [Planctomycetes bacterium]|nr:ATP-grasp domain-containing protein [Planctomycetota bacterium]
MVHVVFAIPFAMENTLRFAAAVARLPGVKLSVVSQDPIEKLPADFRQQLDGFRQVKDAMRVADLVAAVEGLAAQLGPVERLLGILEQAQEALAAVREQLRIRGMDRPTARNFRDKAQMKDLFAAHGVPCARHRLCADAAQALAFAQEVGYPLVGKPPAGAGAKATARCGSPAELQRFLATSQPRPGREVLLEEFIRGREFSFDSVTLHGQHVFHNVCSYHPTPLEVMESPWIQWCVVLPQALDVPEFAAIHKVGPRALSVLGMWTGMSHLEWFRRHDGSIAVSEVAARPPGAQFMTLMSYACDTDMYRAFAQLMVFETFHPPVRRYAAGAVYLRAQAPQGRPKTAPDARIGAVTGLEELRETLGDLVVETRLPRIGSAPATSYEGDGFVVVRHPDTQVVTAALDRVVHTVRVELA